MPLSPQSVLARLFTTPQVQAEWFEPIMLNQYPLQRVQQDIAGMKEDFGAYQQVQPIGECYAEATSREEHYFRYCVYFVVFERGRVAVLISLSIHGQVSGLIFQPAPIGLEATVEQLKTFPGRVNLLVLADDSELASFNADHPLTVDSASDLAVLAALRQQIIAGQRSWSNVVTLQAEWKTCPSSFLQNWPVGTHLTLETLAILMIAVKDNTATEALIHILGQETNETFTQLNFKEHPTALDSGHFFTPRELCKLMAQVADLPLMGIKSSPILDPTDWEKVAYYDGSGLGMLSSTYQVVTQSGKTYCVSITWHDPEALVPDKVRFHMLYASVFKDLKDNL